jgi:hypothetical protein
MSERDLDQKIDLRRAFWAMGASTRLDVKLSAIVPRERGRAASEEWTDLDVLAVEYSPLGGLSQIVADCKTLKGRVAERVFWLRGVADLFSARGAYLTRDHPLPPSARQLAVRLGIAALDPRDRALLLEQGGTSELPRAGHFLERDTFVRWSSLAAASSKPTERLGRYRTTVFWVVSRHRNLTYLVSEVQRARDHLDPRTPQGMVVVLDLAWLYLLTVLRALDEMTRLHLADPNAGMRLVLMGNEQEAQRQEYFAAQLHKLLAASRPSRALVNVSVLPEYYDELAALVARVSRRRAAATAALRTLEFVGVETVANRGATWLEAFPDAEPYGAKLASDVVQFLVAASGLSRDFVARFDSALSHRVEQRSRQPERGEAATQPVLFESERTAPAAPGAEGEGPEPTPTYPETAD